MRLLFGSNLWLSPVLSLVLTTATTMTTSSSWFLRKSAAHCHKNTGYNCGAVFPANGNTCNQKGCCCADENGDSFKLNSCHSATGYAYRGCESCWVSVSCFVFRVYRYEQEYEVLDKWFCISHIFLTTRRVYVFSFWFATVNRVVRLAGWQTMSTLDRVRVRGILLVRVWWTRPLVMDRVQETMRVVGIYIQD